VAIGRTTAGWWLAPPPPRVDAVEGRGVLIVKWRDGAEDSRGTLLHEVAHHWLEPGPALVREPLPIPIPTTRERRADRNTLVRCGDEWGLLGDLVGQEVKREERAAGRARAWGGRGAGADACVLRHATRFRVEHEAAAARLKLME
jgi:hypothetical protein